MNVIIEQSDDFPMSATAQGTPISAVMARDVVCVGPAETLEDLARVLLVNDIGGVPVVDPDRRPLGVVSKTDALRALAEGDRRALAADIMTPVTLTMREYSSIAQAAALMAYEHVHRVVVVNPAGSVVGLVSTIDVLRWLARKDGYAIP
jgi:predicted transcriptional regulator